MVVFYDENGNGVFDADEAVRLPGVGITVAGRRATTGPDGVAHLADVTGFRQAVTLDVRTLPPFYASGQAATLQRGEAHVPVTLPIGANAPNTYMAFGDSITSGVGYTDGQAYRAGLEQRLAAHLGKAKVIDQGSSKSRSNQGAQRVEASLAAVRPAYTLVLYGTNDWNFPACKQVQGCFTVRSLRRILRAVKAAGSLPCLATIPPVNEGFDQRAPPERNAWVAGVDEQIRALAAEEGALLVDVHAAFRAQPDAKALFTDHVHPSEAGFDLIARTFFEALAHPTAATQH